jgi:hypothetical protein
LATLLVFSAFYLLTRDAVTAPIAAIAGALCGAAVAVEYTALIAVLVFGAFLLVKSWRRLGWFVAGGAPFAVLLAWYHTAAFGTPFTHPYRYSAFNEVTDQARGFFATFSQFQPDNLVKILFDGRGFLIASPMVVLGLVGLFMMVRRGSPAARQQAWVGVAVFIGFLMIPLFWGNPWGGDSPGPRYMTPAIPFLVMGASAVWRRAGIWSRVAATVGIVTMGLAVLTDPILSRYDGGIDSWVRSAADGAWVPTVFTMAIGPLGWLIHIVLVAVVGWALYRAHQTEPFNEGVVAPV